MAGGGEARCAAGVVPKTCQDLVGTHCTANLRVCETVNCRIVQAYINLSSSAPTEQRDAQLQAICDDLPDAAYSAQVNSCLRGDDLIWPLFLVLW